MATYTTYDRALTMLASNNGTAYAIRSTMPISNGPLVYHFIDRMGQIVISIPEITFGQLLSEGKIKHAVAFDTERSTVYVSALLSLEDLYNTMADVGGALFDTAHSNVNADAFARAETAFNDIADDVIPYIEMPATQADLASVARNLAILRGSVEEMSIALYRVIDRAPDDSPIDPKLANTYQRTITASTALFDAYAALKALIIYQGQR